MTDDKKPGVSRDLERKIERDNRREVERPDRGGMTHDHDTGHRTQKTTGWNDTPPPPKKNKT